MGRGRRAVEGIRQGCAVAGRAACGAVLPSIAAALGEPPAERDPDLLVSPDMGRRVYEIMVELAMLGPQSVRAKNPIGILGHMAGNDDVALCPLVYGYVNYAAPGSGRPLRFSNAPRAIAGGRPGSTLGGTGIGISRRCAVTPELKRHLAWLMSDRRRANSSPLMTASRAAARPGPTRASTRAGATSTAIHQTRWRRPMCGRAIGLHRLPGQGVGTAARGLRAGPARRGRGRRHAIALPRQPRRWRREIGSAMNEDVLFEIDGQIAVITLNRPQKLNAVTPEMADAIVAAVKECNDSDSIRCVIVTGAGDRAFWAGSDIRELDTYETPWQFRNRPDYCDAIRALLKPSIAAVNGYAFGGGLETAMSATSASLPTMPSSPRPRSSSAGSAAAAWRCTLPIRSACPTRR